MYDAIVVGARCAGSPTAMALARKGYKVLLVDRDTFPSDIMSTHLVTHTGVGYLQRWGLLAEVAASNCPPITRLTQDYGFVTLSGTPPSPEGIPGAFCPRRKVLDAILVRAAVAAGAELREGFSVQEIVSEDGRVTGVLGRSKGGASVTERARIVIGADGVHSAVARAVQAEVYNARPATTCGYYSYWSGIPDEGMMIHWRADRIVFRFPTNDGLTCLATEVPKADFHAFRADIEGSFTRGLEAAAPGLAALAAAGHREERFVGATDMANFYRKPFGPGWALVGDAGYHKDPVMGQGITDAFRDAELLAEALHAGFSDAAPLDQALAGYEQQRNAATAVIYDITCQLASFAPAPSEQQALLAALAGNQEDTDRFLGLASGAVSFAEFTAPENLGRIFAQAQQRTAAAG